MDEKTQRLIDNFKTKSDKELKEMLALGQNAYDTHAFGLLVQEAKWRNIDFDVNGADQEKKIGGAKSLKQHPLVIKAVVFILLSKDLLLVLFAFLGIEGFKLTPGYLIWDLFFSYYLLKGKNWARLFILGRTIFGIIVLSYVYLSRGDYLAWGIDSAIFTCILILLIGQGGKRKALVFASAYSVLALSLLGFVIWGVAEDNKAIATIKRMPATRDQISKEGFKVILPSESWRFITREKALEILGEAAKDADIIIGHLSGDVYGLFVGEDLKKLQYDPESILENVAGFMKTEYLANHKITGESKGENLVKIEAESRIQSTNYKYLYAYRVLNGTGVTCQFWTKSGDFNKFKNEMNRILENLSEISKKQFLPKLSAQEVYAKYNEATVLIRTYDEKERLTGFSSGVNIDEAGLILTNWHAISDAKYVDVKFPAHGTYEDVYVAAISKTGRDLVALAIKAKNLPAVQVDNDIPADIGEKVFVIGNPEGLTNTLSEGLVSGRRNFDGYSYYQITAPISEGSSGGPVFDEFGNMIGLCVGTLRRGQNLNFMIPSSEINDLESLEKLLSASKQRKTKKQR